MTQMTYGETIAVQLAELREQAAQERAARRFAEGQVSAWRRFSGRLLVAAGERLQGCVPYPAEPRPTIRVIG